MRRCKAQNRGNKRQGASGYDKDNNAVVCKKYGVHHGTTSNGTSFRRMSYLTRQTQLTLRPPLITQSYSLCVMSALGHKRTFCDAGAMSALPPKADICSAIGDVRFVPIADIASFFER